MSAKGWFEWQRTGHGKQPFFLALEDGSSLSFAALWERWDKGGEPLESFSIITTAATPALAETHSLPGNLFGITTCEDPEGGPVYLEKSKRAPVHGAGF